MMKKDIGELYRSAFSDFRPETSPQGFKAVQEALRLKRVRVRRIRVAAVAGVALMAVSMLWVFRPQAQPEPISSGDDLARVEAQADPGTSFTQPVPAAPAPKEVRAEAVNTGSGPELPHVDAHRPLTDTMPAPESTNARHRMNTGAQKPEATISPRQMGTNQANQQTTTVQNKSELSIEVSGDTVICLGESVFLEAMGGISYVWSDGSLSPFITVTPERTAHYRVQVTDENNKVHDYTITVTVHDCAELIVPSAFTPNADGRNDVFQPKGRNVDEYKLMVYARTGELVFESTDFYIGWNGEINGQIAPQGVYVYIITYVNRLGDPVAKRGSVTLLR